MGLGYNAQDCTCKINRLKTFQIEVWNDLIVAADDERNQRPIGSLRVPGLLLLRDNTRRNHVIVVRGALPAATGTGCSARGGLGAGRYRMNRIGTVRTREALRQPGAWHSPTIE